MPTARSGLAVAVYESKIYAIGGDAVQGVTGVTEQYDVATDTWTTLLPKPVPVADVGAAVVGGLIYIPGGRLASGGLTDVLESYDPVRNQWEQHAPMPFALSEYSLVAFEGKLYVFGGWDGKKYLNTVFEYEPDTDTWITRTPMSTARGFSGAAIAGEKIYVIGGFDGTKALANNEVYTPNLEGSNSSWSQATSMPTAQYGFGIASTAGNIYIIGGQEPSGALLAYFPQTDQWQTVDSSPRLIGEGSRMVQITEFLYIVGGLINNIPIGQNLAYQAIYTIQFPFIINK
jgi:N-acetylneuraminic acid mutarotase